MQLPDWIWEYVDPHALSVTHDHILLPDWFWEYVDQGRDNYKLRVYLSLLHRKKYAAQLAQEFKEANQTIENTEKSSFPEIKKHPKKLWKYSSKLSNSYFKPLREDEGAIKIVSKFGRKQMHVANPNLLRGLAFRPNPFILADKGKYVADKESYRPSYDVNHAVEVFAYLLHRYAIPLLPLPKTLIEYLILILAFLREEIGPGAKLSGSATALLGSAINFNVRTEIVRYFAALQEHIGVVSRRESIQHILQDLQELGVETEEADLSADKITSGVPIIRWPSQELKLDVKDVLVFLRFYIDCIWNLNTGDDRSIGYSIKDFLLIINSQLDLEEHALRDSPKYKDMQCKKHPEYGVVLEGPDGRVFRILVVDEIQED